MNIEYSGVSRRKIFIDGSEAWGYAVSNVEEIVNSNKRKNEPSETFQTIPFEVTVREKGGLYSVQLMMAGNKFKKRYNCGVRIVNQPSYFQKLEEGIKKLYHKLLEN